MLWDIRMSGILPALPLLRECIRTGDISSQEYISLEGQFILKSIQNLYAFVAALLLPHSHPTARSSNPSSLSLAMWRTSGSTLRFPVCGCLKVISGASKPVPFRKPHLGIHCLLLFSIKIAAVCSMPSCFAISSKEGILFRLGLSCKCFH